MRKRVCKSVQQTVKRRLYEHLNFHQGEEHEMQCNQTAFDLALLFRPSNLSVTASTVMVYGNGTGYIRMSRF